MLLMVTGWTEAEVFRFEENESGPAGVTVKTGLTPLVRLMLRWPAKSLVEIVSIAVRMPVAMGANRTVTVHERFAKMLAPQVLLTEKSPMEAAQGRASL